MPNYYVNMNAQDDFFHEVHVLDCRHGAEPQNQDDLGVHADCRGAVAKAKVKYVNVDGCMYCCGDCHTR